MEDIKAKEDARLRLMQEREAKKLRDAAEKERRALERRAQVEQRKKCGPAPRARPGVSLDAVGGAACASGTAGLRERPCRLHRS